MYAHITLHANITLHATAGDLPCLRRSVQEYQERFPGHIFRPEGRSALRNLTSKAVEAGRTDIAIYFCREVGVPVHYIHEDEVNNGMTPLVAAVSKENEEITLALLAIPQLTGREVTRPLRGMAPNNMLHMAVQCKSFLRVVEELVLRHNMDIQLRNMACLTPLDIAAQKGHVSIVRFLTAQHRAAGPNNLRKALQRKWADGENDLSPCLLYLIVTAETEGDTVEERKDYDARQLEVIKFLVEECGADPHNTASKKGHTTMTALHVACMRGRLGVVDYFIKTCGVSVSSKAPGDIIGMLPIHCAAGCSPGVVVDKEKHLAVVKYLIEEAGADVMATASNGATAKLAAQLYGHREIYAYLLEKEKERRRGRGGGARTSTSGSSTRRSSTSSGTTASTSGTTTSSSRSTASRAQPSASPRPAPAPAPAPAPSGTSNSEEIMMQNLANLAQQGNFARVREVIQEMEGFPGVGREYWRSPTGRRTMRMIATGAACGGHGEIAKHIITTYNVPLCGPPSDIRDAPLRLPDPNVEFSVPLTAAIIHGHEELALELLALPAAANISLSDLFWHSVNEYTVLHMAAKKGIVRVVRELLKRGGAANEQALIEERTGLGMTSLDFAVLHGHVPLARLLLDRYESKGQLRRALNREWGREEKGHRPLLILAVAASPPPPDGEGPDEATRLSMVKFLVGEKDANPWTHYDADIGGGKPAVGTLPIHRAAGLGFLSLVKFFIEQCDQSPSQTAPGCAFRMTPLHCVGQERASVSEAELLRMAEYLVEKGGDLLAKTAEGVRPAEMARSLIGRPRVHVYLAGKEKEAEAAATAAAEALAERAAAELLREEEEGDEEEEEEEGEGGGGGGATQKKKRRRNRKKKRGGSGGSSGGGGAAAAAGDGGGEGEGADQKLDGAMQGLDLDEDGKEGEEKEDEAQAEQEQENEGELEEEDTAPSPLSYTTTATTFDEYLLEDAPESHVCSITLNLMTSPFVASDGFVYSEDGLKGWIETCKSKGKEITSPKTNAAMGEFMIFNQTHRTLVLEYISKKEAEWRIICEERVARLEEEQGKERGNK